MPRRIQCLERIERVLYAFVNRLGDGNRRLFQDTNNLTHIRTGISHAIGFVDDRDFGWVALVLVDRYGTESLAGHVRHLENQVLTKNLGKLRGAVVFRHM